jgi:hypothetical protein
MNYKKRPTPEQSMEARSATVECGLRFYERLSKRDRKEYCLELRYPHHLRLVCRSSPPDKRALASQSGASRAVNATLARSKIEPVVFHVLRGKAERVSFHG